MFTLKDIFALKLYSLLVAKAECLGSQGKSSTSWICPLCSNILQCVSFWSKPLVSPSDSADANNDSNKPPQPVRVQKLACQNCSWSTRDIGLPDKIITPGVQPEPWEVNKNKHLNYFNDMKLHLTTAVADFIKESDDRERKVTSSIENAKKKSKNLKINKMSDNPLANILASKFGKSYAHDGLAALKRHGSAGSRSHNEGKFSKIPEFPLPDFESQTVLKVDFEKDERDLQAAMGLTSFETATSLDSRLLAPQAQPTHVQDLRPIPGPLLLQNSLKFDGHRLLKPDYNAIAIKPKIRNLAIDTVPTIEILRNYNPTSQMVSLLVTNPNYRKTNFYLLPYHLREETDPGIVLKNDINLEQVAPACLLPNSEISLQGSVSSQVNDDEDILITNEKLVWVHKNKARIEVEVPIDVTHYTNLGLDFFWLPIRLKFDYASTIAPSMAGRRGADSSKTEPTIEWLEVKVLVKVAI